MQDKVLGTDILDNEIWLGDDVYVLAVDEYVNAEFLSRDAKELLDYLNFVKVNTEHYEPFGG